MQLNYSTNIHLLIPRFMKSLCVITIKLNTLTDVPYQMTGWGICLRMWKHVKEVAITILNNGRVYKTWSAMELQCTHFCNIFEALRMKIWCYQFLVAYDYKQNMLKGKKACIKVKAAAFSIPEFLTTHWLSTSATAKPNWHTFFFCQQIQWNVV